MARKASMTKEIAEEIVNCGLSIADSAIHYGISESYAEKIIYGRTKFSTLKRAPHKRALTDEQVQAIRQDTRPHKEIAADYGCVPSMVSSIKRYYFYGDVPGPNSKPSKRKGPHRKLTMENLIRMRLCKEKRALKWWALEFGVSITTIFNALNGFSYQEAIVKEKEIADAHSS